MTHKQKLEKMKATLTVLNAFLGEDPKEFFDEAELISWQDQGLAALETLKEYFTSMTIEPEKIAVVTELEVLKHASHPCRYCGHIFEGSKYCPCGLDTCPNCGCPVKEPMNK